MSVATSMGADAVGSTLFGSMLNVRSSAHYNDDDCTRNSMVVAQ